MRRVFFDVDPAYNCTRIEMLPPGVDEWPPLPSTAIDVRIVPAEEIPQDRTFRNAWKADLSVDMLKAREIHKTKLRELRAPLIASLDVEYMRADELGDAAKKAEIAAKKLALRDVTDDPAIEAAATPDELKSVLPQAVKDYAESKISKIKGA